jgi:hypothetical protein
MCGVDANVHRVRVRRRISRPHHNETLTVSRDRPTIVARADVPELVSNRDKIREALTLVSFRD